MIKHFNEGFITFLTWSSSPWDKIFMLQDNKCDSHNHEGEHNVEHIFDIFHFLFISWFSEVGIFKDARYFIGSQIGFIGEEFIMIPSAESILFKIWIQFYWECDILWASDLGWLQESFNDVRLKQSIPIYKFKLNRENGRIRSLEAVCFKFVFE